MGGGNVITITDKADWDAKLAQAKASKKLVVVDFTATWCGPCKMMAPHFEKLSEQFPNALWLKVDVDDCDTVAAECKISAMPTFQFFADGKKLDELVGGNPNGLLQKVEKHYPNFGAFTGQGRTLTGSSAAPEAPAPAPAAGAWKGADESRPTTSIQIMLADGSRLVGKFNHSQTVGDIRDFIKASSPAGQATFQLKTAHPPKDLVDDKQSIEEAGLLNATIMQTK